MSEVYTFPQYRDPDPDYSDEEERYELAKMLLLEANLDGIDPSEKVVEASFAAGFNCFDGMCLRLFAEFAGMFPLRLVKNGQDITIQFGDAKAALLSPNDNIDFWGDQELLDEAARHAPDQWRIHEAEMEKIYQQFLALNPNNRF